MYSSTETLRQAERIALMEPCEPEFTWTGSIELDESETHCQDITVFFKAGSIDRIQVDDCESGEARDIPQSVWGCFWDMEDIYVRASEKVLYEVLTDERY